MFFKLNSWRKTVFLSGFCVIAMLVGCTCKKNDNTLTTNKIEPKQWTGWSDSQNVEVKKVIDGTEDCLRFSVKNNAWNTPMANFDPALDVNKNTIVEFKVKVEKAGLVEINLGNQSENARYCLAFPVKGGEWTSVRKYISDSSFKDANDIPGKEHSGKWKLSTIQIATHGKEVFLKDFSIFDVDEKLEELPVENNKYISDYLAEKKAKPFKILERNGIFPFGPAITVSAGNTTNARFFGQSKIERQEDDFLDIKMHNMNTILNLCDDQNVKLHLDLAQKYKLFLIETAFANTDFTKLPEASDIPEKIRSSAENPNLIAWYGQDEPKNFETYIKNKAALEKLDTTHLVTSALNTPHTRKTLGPCMEVTMPDLYDIVYGKEDVFPALTGHSRIIKESKEQCAGKKIWLVIQTFGGRHSNNLTWRYPTPEEIRFDMYNSVAAGVNGILFFIYNDTVPYLDGQARGEEFDQTLCDAWGNGNEVFDEVAEFGKNIVPIMPSLLDSEASSDIKVKYPESKLVFSESKNELGHYLFFVNKNLKSQFTGIVDATVPEGLILSDLVSLSKTSKLYLALKPGEGRIFMISTPEDFEIVKNEITSRKLANEIEKIEIELPLLKKAGLDISNLSQKLSESSKSLTALKILQDDIVETQKINRPYWEFKTGLDSVKKSFGEINKMLCDPEMIKKTDATKNQEWQKIFEDIKSLSIKYFALKRNLRNGNYGDPSELQKLVTDVKVLQDNVRLKCSSKIRQ